MHNPFLQELKETHNTLFWFENGAPKRSLPVVWVK